MYSSRNLIQAMLRDSDEIEELDCKAVNLLDQSNELGAMIELCQFIAVEDVSIWAEIQRCEFKQRD